MIDKLKELLKALNEKGIPVPMAMDHGQGSVSLTLLILSSLFVMLSLLGGLHPVLEGVGFWESLAWHITSAVLYYNRGRKLGKDGFEISSNQQPEKETSQQENK